MHISLAAAYISFFSAFIPAIVGLSRFKNTPETLRILSVFCVITVIMECIVAYLGYHNANNMFLHHIYTPVEFGFIVFLTSRLLKPGFSKRLLIYFLIAAFAIFCFINALLFESPKNFNSIPRGIEGLLVICLCLYFFYRLFNSDEFFNLLKYPYFWLFSGWLLYFAGTFFLFVYSYQGGMNLTFSIIHSVLNIFLNLTFTYTLWLGSRKSIS